MNTVGFLSDQKFGMERYIFSDSLVDIWFYKLYEYIGEVTVWFRFLLWNLFELKFEF